MSAKAVGSMPYSSGGRPATALSATFEISWPSYTHAFVPSVAGDELRREVDVLRREAAVEQVRRLDHVVVDADQDHVVDLHCRLFIADLRVAGRR